MDSIEDKMKHAREFGAQVGEELARAIGRGQSWESNWVLDNGSFSLDDVGDCVGSRLTIRIKIEPKAVK